MKHVNIISLHNPSTNYSWYKKSTIYTYICIAIIRKCTKISSTYKQCTSQSNMCNNKYTIYNEITLNTFTICTISNLCNDNVQCILKPLQQQQKNYHTTCIDIQHKMFQCWHFVNVCHILKSPTT
jgi:hypothetical protein